MNRERARKKDFEKAMHWYMLAAQQGRPDAAYKLGQFYEHGLGVEEDIEKAEEWYKKAAEEDTGDDAGIGNTNIDIEEKMKKRFGNFDRYSDRKNAGFR
ncbi:MAG: tetratricopeptide repeat protein [Anaerobutyricum hallii]